MVLYKGGGSGGRRGGAYNQNKNPFGMSLSSIGSSVLSHTFFFKNKTNLFHLKLEGAYMSGWVGEEL